MRILIGLGATLGVAFILGLALLLTAVAPSRGTPLEDVSSTWVTVGRPAQ